MRSVLAFFVLCCATLGGSPAPAEDGTPIVLGRGTLELRLSAASGGISSFADRSLPAELHGGATAEAFRLVLRRPDRSIATVRSAYQVSPKWTGGGDRVTAVWTGPLRDEQGKTYAISVRATYALTPAPGGGEELRVWLALDNQSESTVLEVWMPALGGLERIGGEVYGSNRALHRPLKVPFGDWAPNYPGAIPLAFVHLGEQPCLYFGAHEALARFKLLRVHELDGDIVARVTHLPFVGPRGRFVSCAEVFRFHRGGFEESGRMYRSWFVRTFGIKNPQTDWLRQQSFFQMTMMMLPEGNINYRFRDIPRLAADAKRYGVTAIQLAGWQKGGHDGGYPYYEPDPRLGTWDELRRAIQRCHQMGVRVYFFINLQPAMLDIDWYRRELYRYEAESEAGDPFWIAGWGMGTLASRMGLTTPLMAFLDPAFPRYADALMTFYRKLASIGADGVHVDKMFPQALNANPHAPLPRDTSTWEGAIRFLLRMDRECRSIHPSWRVSAECAWDRFLQVGTATWWAGNMTAVRAVFPETVETVGLYQPYDFQGVNNAVREGWVVMVAPYHFQRSMDEPAWRGLSRYIRDVKQIRDRLAATVFMGRQAAASEVKLRVEGPAVAWNVYRHAVSGRCVCIVTNNNTVATAVTLEAWSGASSRAVRVHMPGRTPVRLALPAWVAIPAERLAFLEELPAGETVPSVHAIVSHEPRQAAPPVRRPFANADFEGGTLEGWTAESNWTVDDNSAGGWYSGWQGRRFAWSGRGGEDKTGKLRSPVFRLDGDGVEVSVAGWSDIQGRTPNRWNYVTLNLEDGTELDRVYTPNTTTFTPLILFAPKHRGRRVYLEAVDDAPESTYSMICLDDVRLWNMPAAERRATKPVPGAVVLENEHFRLEVGRTNGTIVRLRDKGAGVELITEPRLSDNWRFSLPVRDAVGGHLAGVSHRRWPESWRNHEGNYVRGRLQRLTGVKRHKWGLTLTWSGPMPAEDGRRYPVSVEMTVRLRGDALSFQTIIRNRSALEVGEVYAPILGGVTGLGASSALRKLTEVVTPRSSRLDVARPFHTFMSQSWLGIFGPEAYAPYPTELDGSWAVLRNRSVSRMLYFAAHDPVARFKVLHMEMVPGVSGPRPTGNWPTDAELHGAPAGVRMSWMHMAYQPAGTDFVASPVVLRSMKGTAEDARRYYMEWLKSQHRLRDAMPASAWRTIGRTSFSELPAHAREAVQNGQTALLLTDWRAVAPESGVPSWEPDPALGGYEGLRKAAEECGRLGVALIVQVRINPVSTRSELFMRVLRGFRTIDRWGVPQTLMGWGQPRTTAEAHVAGERRCYINTGHPGCRAWLVSACERLAEAGVAGAHLQGFFANVLDFNPTLGSSPDRGMWGAPLATLDAMVRAGRRHMPRFRVTVEERRDLLGSGE